MARVRKNSIFEAISGTIGKEIVFKQYRDKTVVSKYPDMSKVKASPLQTIQRNKIKEANAYASAVKRDPELRARYEKELRQGESVFHKAKKDYLKKMNKS